MNALGFAERVPVLMYHRVDARVTRRERPYCVSARQFAAHLDWLARQGYRPCSTRDFADWYLGHRPLPQRSVLITFDDGFAGLHQHAWPLLAARSWPATVFLVSGLTGQHNAWGSSEFGAPGAHALLNAQQIDEMARNGIDFQSHSCTHADLTTLDAPALTRQVAGSRRQLEDLLGRAVDCFAYPYGRHDDRVRDAVQAAGYRVAFSVQPGFNRPGGDPWAVRRLDITGGVSTAGFGRMVAMGSNDGSLGQQLRYLSQRLRDRLHARAASLPRE